MKNKHFIAFTLAEVLITLGIIGVIAAIIIPVLWNNYEKQKFNSQLKKTFQELSSITTSIKNDNGGTMANAFLDIDNYRDGYATYFKYAQKTCPANNVSYARTNGCFMQGAPKNIDGTSINDLNWGANNSFLILQDGRVLGFYGYWDANSKQCQTNINGLTICGSIIVDLNGPNPPNTIGKDFFALGVTANGLIAPYYTMGYNQKCNQTADTYNSKDGCAALILMGIDYY